MINLTVDEIIQIHEKLIQKTGGMSGLRDFGMLESAVYSAMQSFGEEEVYPTSSERAARLAYAITMNHPFLDDNKRTIVKKPWQPRRVIRDSHGFFTVSNSP